MSEDGPWLDMSVYPDIDPDSAISASDLLVLDRALDITDVPISESEWAHMLDVAVADPDLDTTDTSSAPEPDTDSWLSDDDDHAVLDVPFDDDHHGGLSGGTFDEVEDGHESGFW